MRWPSWWGRRDTAPATEPGADTPPATGRPDFAEPGRAAWRSATPLHPTLSLRSPALTPPGLPDVTGTRPLLHRRLPATVDLELSVPAGRVDGLAVAAPTADPGSAVELVPAAALAPVPPRALPAYDRRPRTELVHATDEYVGPARVPDQPHRAPGWLRALSQAPAFEPIPGLPPALAAMPIQPAPRTGLPGSVAQAPPAGRPELPAQPPSTQTPPGALSPGSGSPATAPRRSGLGPPVAGPVTGRAGPASAGGRTGTVRARGRGGLGPPLVPAPTGAPPHPGQRAAREPAPHPPAGEEPEPAVPVPTELTQAMRAAYGVEVGDVPVRSGPQARQEAQEHQARAFAAEGEVVLGTAPGGDGTQRALIAHELVHLVQQRELGGALPDERSPQGRALEADAVAAEHAVLTGRSMPPLSHRPLGKPVAGATRAVARRVQRAMDHPDTATATRSGGQTQHTEDHHTEAHHADSQHTAAPQTAGPQTPTQQTGTQQTGTQQSGRAGHRRDEDPDPWRLRGDRTTRWNRFTEVLGHDVGNFVGSPLGLDIDQIRDVQAHHDGTASADDDADGTGQSGTGRGGTGRGGSGRGGAGGRGRSPNDDEDPDPWRLRGDRTTRRNRFTEVLGHDVGNFVGSPLGLDIDQIRDVQSHGADSAQAGAQGGGAGAGGGTGVMGPVVHTDPSRPLSHTGRPQIDTDDLDLDELAVRLYDRLRSKLRMELLHDRERAGLLTDFR